MNGLIMYEDYTDEELTNEIINTKILIKDSKSKLDAITNEYLGRTAISDKIDLGGGVIISKQSRPTYTLAEGVDVEELRTLYPGLVEDKVKIKLGDLNSIDPSKVDRKYTHFIKVEGLG